MDARSAREWSFEAAARAICLYSFSYYATLLPRRDRILRRTLSVRLSVRPVIVTIATSVTCFRHPCGRAVSFVLFTCQGRISFGDLSRTSLFNYNTILYLISPFSPIPLTV